MIETDDYQMVYRAPCTALGICFNVEFTALTRVDFLPIDTTAISSAMPLAQETTRQLNDYFAKLRFDFNLPIILCGTAYQKKVWQALITIPAGYPLTYMALANKIDSGARAVGNACGQNRLSLIIPCHRIVGTKGIGGFNRQKTATMLAVKQWLLQHEQHL